MGKFVIRAVPSGFKFNLKADNGEVIAASEVYDTHAACIKGVESVRKAAQTPKVGEGDGQGLTNPKYELYTDRAGEYRFRLKARNGKIVAVSEGYATRQGCLEGIECVRRNAPEGTLEEH